MVHKCGGRYSRAKTPQGGPNPVGNQEPAVDITVKCVREGAVVTDCAHASHNHRRQCAATAQHPRPRDVTLGEDPPEQTACLGQPRGADR